MFMAIDAAVFRFMRIKQRQKVSALACDTRDERIERWIHLVNIIFIPLQQDGDDVTVRVTTGVMPALQIVGKYYLKQQTVIFYISK